MATKDAFNEAVSVLVELLRKAALRMGSLTADLAAWASDLQDLQADPEFSYWDQTLGRLLNWLREKAYDALGHIMDYVAKLMMMWLRPAQHSCFPVSWASSRS